VKDAAPNVGVVRTSDDAPTQPRITMFDVFATVYENVRLSPPPLFEESAVPSIIAACATPKLKTQMKQSAKGKRSQDDRFGVVMFFHVRTRFL